MPIQLPTAPAPPSRISPKILILYSLPKVGKTEELSKLPGCLLLDADEEGAAPYTCMKFNVYNSQDIKDVRKAIEEEGTKRHSAGKRGEEMFPYDFIAIDTIDKLEEFADVSATAKYRRGPLNAKGNFETKGYTSVTELPDGAGYYYTRNELLELVADLAAVCPRLIITAHVKDKKLADKTGDIATFTDISLIGKMGSILCAKADAIGYMYRSAEKANFGNLMVSFQTNESSVMGARQKYLAGKKMPFNWATIYPDVFPEGSEKRAQLDAMYPVLTAQ